MGGVNCCGFGGSVGCCGCGGPVVGPGPIGPVGGYGYGSSPIASDLGYCGCCSGNGCGAGCTLCCGPNGCGGLGSGMCGIGGPVCCGPTGSCCGPTHCCGCTAGVGFDAQVAYDFSKKKSRGFLNYIITSIQTFFGYKGIDCQLFCEEIETQQNAFAITFANASQYGNDAVVAPESSINDGLIDMVILKPFSFIDSIFIAIRLFTNSFSKSKFVTTIKGKQFELSTRHNLLVHFDGEPKQLNTSKIIVRIDDKKLNVIC